MSAISREEREELAKALNRFNHKADALLGGNSNTATISVNAGGIGLWICVTACVVMLSINLALGLMYLDLRRSQDRTQDHLSTIYLLVPDLRKQVEETLNNRKEP